jgi:hypothetical protein
MKASITYRVGRILHPWDKKMANNGEYAWCLIKVITPEMGRVTEEPVAIFNFDSEARMFQGHVYASKLDGKLVEIDKDVKELCKKGIHY